jgi:ferredoxin
MADGNGVRSRLGRRAFVELLGRGTVVFVLGGLIHVQSFERSFIRPPGALPEDDFLRQCTRCGKCLAVCRTIILPVSLAESVIAAGTPKLRMPCIACGRCSWVCPTGALGRF